MTRRGRRRWWKSTPHLGKQWLWLLVVVVFEEKVVLIVVVMRGGEVRLLLLQEVCKVRMVVGVKRRRWM